MAATIMIGGADRSIDVVLSSIRISERLGSRVSTCSFEMRCRNPSFKPREGQEVRMEESAEGLIFAGRIGVAEEQEYAVGHLVYTVTCLDHTREGDKNLVVERYPAGWTRGAIARDIVAKYCPGFTAATVPDGPIMPAKRFDYLHPSECFTALARETGGEWYWDYHKALHMFNTGAEEQLAPFEITDDGTGEHPGDLVISPDIQDVATRVYVLGGEYYGNTFPQSFRGDGVKREFDLAYKPKNVVVTLNSAPQTVAVDDLLNQVEDPDWTFNFQEKLLKRGPDRATPLQGDLIEVTYNPQLPVRVVMDDADAQARLAALMGNDGVYEASMVDSSLDSKEAARLAGRAYLAEHANPLIHGGYSTLRPGLRPGMRQRIRLASRGVDMEILIGEVVRQALTVGWRYSVNFATKLMGIEDLIRQLVEAQKRVPARDDETLDIILGLKDPLPPGDQVTIQETEDYRGVTDHSLAGYCEVSDQLAQVDTQAEWQAGTVPVEADGDVFPGHVMLAKFQDCPPFEEWTLFGTAFVNEDRELVMPDGTARAESPLIPVEGLPKWSFSAEFYSDQVSPTHASFNPAGTLCVKYLGSSYFDANSQPVQNSAGYTGNGNATAWGQPGAWSPRTPTTIDGRVCSGSWAYDGGPNVQSMRIIVRSGNGYTPPTFKVRRPMLVTYSVGNPYYEPYQYRYQTATIQTQDLDLGAEPPARPVMLYPVMANDSPPEGNATVTRYRTRALQTDPWGPWTATIALPSGGYLTDGPPQRYLQAEAQLATTDTTKTPVLDRLGVYD